MENKNLVLIYIRNGSELQFPVKDIDHAIHLADAIAESDLLNDDIDYNLFDVCYFRKHRYGIVVGDSWESDDGEDFDEYWKNLREKERNNE